MVEKGQIVKVSKDKNGIVTREVLTKNWTDWIDYWAVDFNFESKREIIRVKNEESGEWEERWTGDYIFEKRVAILPHQERPLAGTDQRLSRMRAGRRKLAVKVVDIFGNDTMTIVEVSVGGKNNGTPSQLSLNRPTPSSTRPSAGFRRMKPCGSPAWKS